MNLYQYVANNPIKYIDPNGTHVLGAVLCDGNGGFEAFYPGPGQPGFEQMQLGCIKEIVEAHEGVHLKDWQTHFPDACYRWGKRKNGPIHRGGNPYIYKKKLREFLAESERIAWQDSYERIQAWLDENTESESCDLCPVTVDVEDGQGSPVDWLDCCEWMKKTKKKAEKMRRTGVY